MRYVILAVLLMMNNPFQNPWAIYQFLSQLQGGQPGGGFNQPSPFGGLSGSSVRPPTPPPAPSIAPPSVAPPSPPPTSQTTTAPTALPMSTAAPTGAPPATGAPTPAPTGAPGGTAGYWAMGPNGQPAWTPGVPAPGMSYFSGTQQTGPLALIGGQMAMAEGGTGAGSGPSTPDIRGSQVGGQAGADFMSGGGLP